MFPKGVSFVFGSFMFRRSVSFMFVVASVGMQIYAAASVKQATSAIRLEESDSKSAAKVIYIYNGDGADWECLQHCRFCVGTFCKSSKIEEIKADSVKENDWKFKARAIIIGGGKATDYQNSLRGLGCENIRNFVRGGGVYLGICAGAYFGADTVDFATDSPGSGIYAKRDLKFFPGVAKGPMVPYESGSRSGERAQNVRIQIGTEEGYDFYSYYNGGGTFLIDKPMSGVEILGRYIDHEEQPAIIRCSFGSGYAILSGVHFEFASEMMEKTLFKEIKPIGEGVIAKVQSTDELRQSFLQKMFADIETRSYCESS